MQTAADAPYPASLEVDYPDELDRLTTAFRVIWALPIFVVVSFMSNTVVIPVLLMQVFRRKYPRWWYDWNLQLTRFSTRFAAYLGLLRDEYPSTDEEQAVHLDFVYPDVERDLNQWLPLVKWFLAIPHYIVLFVLGIVAIVLVVIAWFAILFTGQYPRGIFDFVVGVMRWTLRVEAYAFLLVTDRYPPFSLQ